MEPIHYLRALRRRWLVIAASVMVAMTAAWVTTETVTSALPSTTSAGFQATTVLWSPTTASLDGTLSLGVGPLATIAVLPDVAVRAADAMGTDIDPLALRTQVQATADLESGFLNIVGFAATPKEAEAISTAFSDALISYLRDLKLQGIKGQEAILRQQLETFRAQGATDDIIVPIRTALAQLAISRTTPVALTPIQTAIAEPVPEIGFRPPESRTIRLLIAAIIGLLAGITLALILERFDTKIRTRQAAADHFELPVLAEVPVLPRQERQAVSVVMHPTGKAADAFRLLGASVAGAATVGIHASANGNGNGHAAAPARTPSSLLVTSPGPSDGKTTVSANLAAVYGELGWRVIVVSCDLRRPSIHRLFRVPVQPGLSELLRGEGRLDPDWVMASVQPTGVANVSILPSGIPPASPGELLSSERMRQLLQILTNESQIVILDCSPVLVASDVAALLPDVDAVLVVARAGKTPADLAERTSTVLGRLRAPVVGVALNEAREISMPSNYRRYYRPTRKELRKEGASR